MKIFIAIMQSILLVLNLFLLIYSIIQEDMFGIIMQLLGSVSIFSYLFYTANKINENDNKI